VAARIIAPVSDRLDKRMLSSNRYAGPQRTKKPGRSWLSLGLVLVFWLGLLYAGIRMFAMLTIVPASEWVEIVIGVGATGLRVVISLVLALAWTVPVGVAIGMNRRLAAFLQPVVQIAASIPATALFPVILLFILGLPGSLNVAAVLLMLLGSQWYVLFNVIAGVSAIPEDLKHTTALLQLGRIERWKSLNLPALFPYLVTGAITAGGGAWNASIVAEYLHFSGETFQIIGIGALIARSTAAGDYPLLLAATLSMVLAVILMNRLLWRRLFLLAEEKYRME
jgi:NitT/TauT family transport system permease protein